MCGTCGIYNVLKNAPAWKTTCGECYIKSQRSDDDEENAKAQKYRLQFHLENDVNSDSIVGILPNTFTGCPLNYGL